MTKFYNASNGNVLTWDEELGMGYLQSNAGDSTYDEGYWNQYMKLRNTDMGKALTKARCELTKKAGARPDNTLDIGIGNGQFVDEFGCNGFDVNPYAVKWLKSIKKFSTPEHDYGYEWFTMWDVIEHIEPEEFVKILKHNHKGIVLSTPIYKSFDDVITSKHFKPNEHILYFTTQGIIMYMEYYGYKCTEMSTIESQLGRHSIGSFIFEKR